MEVFLFSGEDVLKKVKVLSGGEKSRVGLACVLAQKSNLLLLDEPTNHLDMKSNSSLIAAIKNYSGTMVFVSHDRNLINEVSTHIFAMLPDGRSMLFEGQLDDYVKLANLANFPNILDTSSSEKNDDQRKKISAPTPKTSSQEMREKGRKKSRIEKSLQKLDLAIEKKNNEIKMIESKLASTDPANFTEIMQLNESRESLVRELDELEQTWLQNQEELESIGI